MDPQQVDCVAHSHQVLQVDQGRKNPGVVSHRPPTQRHETFSITAVIKSMVRARIAQSSPTFVESRTWVPLRAGLCSIQSNNSSARGSIATQADLIIVHCGCFLAHNFYQSISRTQIANTGDHVEEIGMEPDRVARWSRNLGSEHGTHSLVSLLPSHSVKYWPAPPCSMQNHPLAPLPWRTRSD